MSEIVILGCGYVGTRIARQCLERGDTVSGWVRSPAGLERLKGLGIPSVPWDLDADALPERRLAGVRLFHLVPPVDQGTEDAHTRRLVAAFDRLGHPARIVYMSTTGVYGDCRGEWVDESWPARPAADRSRRRLDAEDRLRRWSLEHGGELVVLRVSGIYGPGRLPLARLRQGAPMVRPEDAPYSNRIHVDDLVRVSLAAMDRAPSGAIYNVSDGHPSTMTDYFIRIADAAGLPRPPLIPMSEAAGQLSAGMLTYMSESRRLSNRKLLEELGIQLEHPTLAEGLGDAIARGGASV